MLERTRREEYYVAKNRLHPTDTMQVTNWATASRFLINSQQDLQSFDIMTKMKVAYFLLRGQMINLRVKINKVVDNNKKEKHGNFTTYICVCDCEVDIYNYQG